MRRELTVPLLVVAVTVVVVSTLGAIEVLADPYTDSPLAFLGVAAPALTGIWMTIELCWTKIDRSFLDRWKFRLVFFAAPLSLINTIVHAIVLWQPAVDSVARYPDSYDSALAAWGMTLLGFDLLGFGAALIGALLALIAVVLPYFAVARRREFAEGNMLETDEKSLRSVPWAGIGLSVVLILTFLIPSFIVFGEEYDNPVLVVIGWWLIPLGVAALIVTAVVQRPDRARRDRAGLN